MRLLICAGGTGGGVYPALAVLQYLLHESGDAGIEAEDGSKIVSSSSLLRSDLLWVGGSGGMEADLVKREGIPFTTIPAAGVHGVGPRALPGNLLRLSRGFLASRRILRQFQPDVVLFTGGYVAVPMALAARLNARRSKRPRSLVFIPDIEPGLALKVVVRVSDMAAGVTDETRRFLPKYKPYQITGYPVRKELLSWNKETARKGLGLSGQLPVLFVSGGSKGARSLNRALLRALPELLQEMQIIHISGQLDWPDIETARRTLTDEAASRYHAYPYLHEQMGAALAAADLAITRAGASTLGEFTAMGLPAILVPYPYAWHYQKVNAQYLARQGAAIEIEDADLPVKLLPLVRELVHDPDRLMQMQRSMRSLARPDAVESLAQVILNLAGPTTAERREQWSA
ncbi:MAG: UDP-N-acetylglucosamine--N-acetylmuramyl-(pentapeptide) pyrophosphoryl-undecaprenol N-acetylglucosamine transferase [Omnitrophica WOR_2 bacterium]